MQKTLLQKPTNESITAPSGAFLSLIKFNSLTKYKKRPAITDPLKYKIGDVMRYVIGSKTLYTGTIVEAKRIRLYKPYTLTDSITGQEFYAHEEYLLPA